MKRARCIGYAVICCLQIVITLIQVFEQYTDPYVYFAQDWLVGFNFCGVVLYLVGLSLFGMKLGSFSDSTEFVISGALNLVCLLVLYTLFIWCIAAFRAARRKHVKPA